RLMVLAEARPDIALDFVQTERHRQLPSHSPRCVASLRCSCQRQTDPLVWIEPIPATRLACHPAQASRWTALRRPPAAYCRSARGAIAYLARLPRRSLTASAARAAIEEG